MIANVVTLGFGNGTFNGSVALVVTLGFSIGAAAAIAAGSKRFQVTDRDTSFQVPDRPGRFKVIDRPTSFEVDE